jgi:hypothetical protein
LSKLLGEKGDLVVKQVRTWLGLISESFEFSEKGPVEWPAPVYLDQVPEVPPFPVQVLPGQMQTLVQAIAWSLPCPPDFAAIPLLAMAGGAIANSRRLAIKRSHKQSPCLYVAYIALPGTKKSAPLGILRKPFDAAQRRYIEDYKAELEAWKETIEEGEGEAGPKPILRRCVVSDTTTESLAITLGDNPRGVDMIRNELSALMAGMNQYKGGKGNDRQFYLNNWDGEPIYIDRKSDKGREGIPLFVGDPFCAIVGNIQPAILGTLRGESRPGSQPADDGFMDRFLFAYPNDIPVEGELWREVSQGTMDDWGNAIEKLLGLGMGEYEGRIGPCLIKLTRCGEKAWQRFTEDHANEMNAEDFQAHLRGPWSKLFGYCARLALIVHYLRWVTGETNDEVVDGESMNRAAELVAYFKEHARKVYA